jgi:hypothetical protein
MARLRTLIQSHSAVLALLVAHGVMFWWVIASGSPWATGPVECAAGTMADTALGRIDWPLLDTFDGALGGMFVAGMTALPLYSLGATGLAMKLTAWISAVLALVVAYVLLDRHAAGGAGSRRFAALAGVAALGFGPPAVLHTQLTFGNWHWTQLLFDYGVALWALELLRAERAGDRPGALPWLGFGAFTGLGVFNNFGSLPFLAASWAGLALFLPRAIGVRTVGRLVGAGVAALVGATPFLVKMVHQPFGRAAPSDQTVGRLSRITPDPSRILELMGEELAWALHVHDVLPDMGSKALAMAGIWVAVCWIGLALASLAAIRRRALGVAVPVVFAVTFCAAVSVIQTDLSTGPLVFSNVRGLSARVVPPLLTALVLASAMGWTALSDLVDEGSVPRLVLRFVALVPAAIGFACFSALPSALDVGGVDSYRASCMDVTGYYASKHFRDDPSELFARCQGLSDPGVARACTAGAAWGAGYYALEFASRDERPTGWDPSQVALAPSAARACSEYEGSIRDRCLLGLGWHIGQLDWRRDKWPLRACSSLPLEDRGPCWRGVGFHLGDHLAPTPPRIGRLVARVPARWRRDAARGAGYSIGRTWADLAVARAICARTGPLAEQGCADGIEDALADR